MPKGGKGGKYVMQVGPYKGQTYKWIAEHDYDFFDNILQWITKNYKTISKDELQHARNQHAYMRAKKRGKLTMYAKPNQVIVDEILEREVMGESVEEIKESLRQRKLGEKYIISIFAEVNRTIKGLYEQEKSEIIKLHTLRYDQIFQSNFNIKFTGVKLKDVNRIYFHFPLALDSMLQREKLCGFHLPKFKIYVSNFFEEDRIKKEKELTASSIYDFSRLTYDELIELNTLLDIVVKEEDENEIKVQQREEQEEWIEDAVIVPNPEDINTSLKEVQQPEPPKEVEIVHSEKPKNLFEVKEIMKKNFEKKVKEAMEKIIKNE